MAKVLTRFYQRSEGYRWRKIRQATIETTLPTDEHGFLLCNMLTKQLSTILYNRGERAFTIKDWQILRKEVAK